MSDKETLITYGGGGLGKNNNSNSGGVSSEHNSHVQHGGNEVDDDVNKRVFFQWRDTLCSCSNVYPSCLCLFVFHGSWLVAQIAQREGLLSFDLVLIPYLFVLLACAACAYIYSRWIILAPAGYVLLVALYIRVKLVNKYQILEYGLIPEIFTSLLCCPCSVAQMARHVFGYRKRFDGDSDPSGRMSYRV